MILLDTHVLIWLIRGEQRLGEDALELIASQHPLYYSSISVLEMMIKMLQGRLELPSEPVAVLDDAGLRQLPFVAEDAVALTRFPELLGHDPFDRALVAQAAGEGLTFLTADRRLLALDRSWIGDATV